LSRRIYGERKSHTGKIIFLIFLLVILGSAVYISLSSKFERNVPRITLAEKIVWNLRTTIPLQIEDDTGIKYYRVKMIQGDKVITLAEAQLPTPQKEIVLDVAYPQKHLYGAPKGGRIVVEVGDISLWNMFEGNKAMQSAVVEIDKRKPHVNIISKSYALRKGGSALVIFEAQDRNLASIEVVSNHGDVFYVAPFYRQGFYAALVAHDLRYANYRLFIHAKDRAGNLTKTHIPFYHKSRNYSRSTIKLSDRFLNGKITELFFENYAEDFETSAEETPLAKRFYFVNELLRERNENLIREIARNVPSQTVMDFPIVPFYPMKNGAKVGSFGAHRTYNYKGEKISNAYHMGLDLASVKMANIVLSNSGKVVYTGDNGIYGNMPIISHGLGLYSLYAHCSSLVVNVDQELQAGDIIGSSGTSGLALGDHLHFTVLVQGVMVRPEEWMDKQWILYNITNVIKEAKRIIGSSDQ